MVRKFLFAVALLIGAPIAFAAPLQVLTTIKPLQLIAVAVGGDRAEVDVLLDPRLSPHDYQLKPSDRQKLARADVVFWVGPGLEVFLERALTSAKGGSVVALQPAGSPEHDAHIWMDPLAAVAIADVIAAKFSELRPADAAVFRHRADQLRNDLERLNRELTEGFAQIRQPRGYLVSHDAFAGFERRYGLHHVAAIADGHERPPGPRHMLDLQGFIARGEVACVLLEPQYDRKIVDAVIAGRSVNKVLVDPLAANLAPGEPLVVFYRKLGQAVQNCVSGRGQ